MLTKRLVVLANSAKKQAHCVAGREINAAEGIADWCRPISERPEGELLPMHMRLQGADSVRPLQIIDVPLKAYAGTAERHQSLYLIRPQNLRVRCWREQNRYRGYPQKKARALFTYRGIGYDMSLTDPVLKAEHCNAYPDWDRGEAPAEIELPYGDRCVLCVSLTPVFQEQHYKVIAAVLPLP